MQGIRTYEIPYKKASKTRSSGDQILFESHDLLTDFFLHLARYWCLLTYVQNVQSWPDYWDESIDGVTCSYSRTGVPHF